jgi:hypothetical protein
VGAKNYQVVGMQGCALDDDNDTIELCTKFARLRSVSWMNKHTGVFPMLDMRQWFSCNKLSFCLI